MNLTNSFFDEKFQNIVFEIIGYKRITPENDEYLRQMYKCYYLNNFFITHFTYKEPVIKLKKSKSKKSKKVMSKVKFGKKSKNTPLDDQLGQELIALSWENDDTPPSTDIMIMEFPVYFHKIELSYPKEYSTFHKYNQNAFENQFQ